MDWYASHQLSVLSAAGGSLIYFFLALPGPCAGVVGVGEVGGGGGVVSGCKNIKRKPFLPTLARLGTEGTSRSRSSWRMLIDD